MVVENAALSLEEIHALDGGTAEDVQTGVCAHPRVERILLGTATLTQSPSPTDLLDDFVAAGGRRLDLANVYGEGSASRIVGRWLARASPSTALGLYVKGCHPPFCGPRFVQREVDRARTSLSVSSLDYFVSHRDDPNVSIEAWAEALQSELERGTVRAVGVSNWSLSRFAALRATFGSQRQRVAVFSNHFSLAEMVTPTMPRCRAVGRSDARRLAAESVQVVAWAPLAGGFFAGRDQASWDSDANRARRRRTAELAASYGVSPSAIALAYVLSEHEMVMAAVGTRSPDHLRDLIAAAAIELRSDEIDRLEGAVEGAAS